MKTARTSPALSLLVAGALALVACGGSDAASDADPCDAAQDVADAFDEGERAESGEEAVAAFASLAAALDGFAGVTSGEVKSDAELLASGISLMAESDPVTGPSEETLEIISTDEYDRAGDRLEAYVEETCGIEFG